jgi:hypothetical protein
MLLIPAAIFLPQIIQSKFEDKILQTVLITEENSKDPNHKVFRSWKNSSDEGATPTKMHAYFFNITNADGILQGEKPNVVEIGPYVYTIVKQKDKINFTVDTFGENIVEYYEWKEYLFSAEDSKYVPKDGSSEHPIDLTENDLFISANLVFQLSRAKGEDDVVENYGGDQWTDFDRQFASKTVKQWLFGWLDDQYNVFGDHYFPGLIGKPIHSVDEVTTGAHAMYTGETRIGNAFQYSQHDGVKGFVPNLIIKSWPMWSTYDASRLVGTDGTRFPPNMKKNKPIQVYVDEAKRSLPLECVDEYKLQGLDILDYRISELSMQNSTTNPANGSWSMTHTGIFNLSQSKIMPLILTKPHFLDCEEDLRDGVTGLNPNKDLHDTTLGIHKLSGIVMNASKSLQVSVNTIGPLKVNKRATTWFPNMGKNTFHPIAYMSEKGRISDSDARELQSNISWVQFLANMTSYGFLIICVLFLAATAFFLYKAYQTKVASFSTFNSGAYGDYNGLN